MAHVRPAAGTTFWKRFPTSAKRFSTIIGLRVRFGSKISKRTRIEVITEGVFTRLVLDDPFSADARVDVTLRTDSGLVLLPALQGIDVPGRSRVVIAIHNQAVRQARVAVEVHANVGQVVAAQTLDFAETLAR